MNAPSSLLTTIQAAAQLNVHPDTLRAWRKEKGRGPIWIRIGNRYRYAQESINEFIASSEYGGAR